MIAFCFASGVIKMGRSVPSGAIAIARGDAAKVRNLIEATSRLAYDNETWLVPGVPEAPNDQAALKALEKHLAWLRSGNRPGVVVSEGPL